MKKTSPNTKDDLTQKRWQPHTKLKINTTKTEDDLTQKQRRPNSKTKTTSPKNIIFVFRCDKHPVCMGETKNHQWGNMLYVAETP